ncbi:larval serum protein 1 alpha chain, partial [Cephus cinctus]|uniref:Larval serum protein 1 alpha chain n=1 Tax=Cephus cinctus TaxID=211228 RepID=A0AAJ7BTA2_CEPCN
AVTPELEGVANSWSFEHNKDKYNNQNAVNEFIQRYHEGLLPRGEIFSLMYQQHFDEAVNFFHVLYSAVDYTTFYNTAVWARFNMNEMMFTYVFSVAVLHHPDTVGISLPPLYEVIPHFFFDTQMIYQAMQYKMSKDPTIHHSVVFPANHSQITSMHTTEPQVKTHYFTDDIGLNEFYFYFMNEVPYFMTSHEVGMPKGIRGELFLFVHKQLLVRYYFERLSNGLGEIEKFDWSQDFPVGYHPTISLPNGVPFPEREPWSPIPVEKYDYVQEIEDVESRIYEAINSGHVIDPNYKPVNIYSPGGLDILGNIIQGNADSYNPHLYGSFVHLAKKIFGFNVEPFGKYPIYPSVLEYFTTSMRDPAFYVLMKKVVNFYMQYKSHMPAYTHNELIFDGVTIEHVSVDQMITYFENFEADMSNALWVNNLSDAEHFSVKASEPRLTYKPFNYQIKITSGKNTNAVVRIFLGPKYDVHGHVLNITDNYMNFLEVDLFDVKLKVGNNVVERSSKDSVYVVPDETSSHMYMEKIKKSMKSGEPFTYEKRSSGFPERLFLPKGTKSGMPMQMFVYVSQYEGTPAWTYESPVWGTMFDDGKPMGFPLDRPVYGFNFTVPNMYFKDVTIYHKEIEELNLTI